MLHRSQNASATNAAKRLATIRIAAKGCLHFALSVPPQRIEICRTRSSLCQNQDLHVPGSFQVSGLRLQV